MLPNGSAAHFNAHEFSEFVQAYNAFKAYKASASSVTEILSPVTIIPTSRAKVDVTHRAIGYQGKASKMRTVLATLYNNQGEYINSTDIRRSLGLDDDDKLYTYTTAAVKANLLIRLGRDAGGVFNYRIVTTSIQTLPD